MKLVHFKEGDYIVHSEIRSERKSLGRVVYLVGRGVLTQLRNEKTLFKDQYLSRHWYYATPKQIAAAIAIKLFK